MRCLVPLAACALTAAVVIPVLAQDRGALAVAASLDVRPRPIASDPSVRWDYDIVYVRAPRNGDDVGTNWPEIANPHFMDAGADLVLLHPDGSEEVLVAGGRGS